MNPILATLLYCISILFIAYPIITYKRTISRIGSQIIGIVGTIILLFTLFYATLQEMRLHIIFNLLYLISSLFGRIFLLSFLLFCLVITYTAMKKPAPNRDAIIVLGAGLKGDKVSLSLAHRLDAAYHYYRTNPSTIIVVSGGLGEDELIHESLAMKNYLIDTYQMNPNKIRMESTSTRTLENFQYSKKLLDDYFQRPYTVVYVTNNFHVYRSGLLAKQTGLDAQGLGAPSAYYLLPNFYVREYLSLIKYYLVDHQN